MDEIVLPTLRVRREASTASLAWTARRPGYQAICVDRLGGRPYSEIFALAASSPTIPRRKESTQATKTTPWMTVTHSPNWAR